MSVSPQNSYVETLTPNVMVLGAGAFEKPLGHDGGALMNEINVLIKETPGSSVTLPFCYARIQQEADSLQPSRGLSPGPDHAGLISDFQFPEL